LVISYGSSAAVWLLAGAAYLLVRDERIDVDALVAGGFGLGTMWMFLRYVDRPRKDAPVAGTRMAPVWRTVASEVALTVLLFATVAVAAHDVWAVAWLIGAALAFGLETLRVARYERDHPGIVVVRAGAFRRGDPFPWPRAWGDVAP
jgi:hypothetical protein